MKGRTMRHAILATTLLGAAALAVGCTSKEVKASVEPKQAQPSAAHLEKAKAETKQAEQEMRNYAYAERAEFVVKMKKELVSIQDELDQLGAKVESAGGSAKADARVKLAAVREKWAQAKKQVDRAETATASDWDDVKSGFKQSYVDLKDSFDKTRQWLSDKIAP
jgi:acyl-CoA reductase-like NAD-dependent aldehyde dehydrogenase